jgi:predicted MFS family arabinose efflux permease
MTYGVCPIQAKMAPVPGGTPQAARQSGAAVATRTVTLARMNRWAILAGFGLLAACTQLLWLAYAPITTQVHRAMGVSVGAAGDLAGIFPLMYVVLALPSGRWLDAQFERALSAGAILTAGGALLRLAGPASFAWALAGQFVVAAGQPLVLNSITKVAARYFPEQERTAAISAGSVSLYAGILAAVLTSGQLFDAGGLRLLLTVQAAVAVLAAAWVLLAVRTPAAYGGDPAVAVSLRWLWHDRFLWVLGGLLFVGMGVFNAVATWLDSILGHFGRGGAAGYLIAIMTVAGILGAAVVPQAVARRDRRRALLQVTVGVTIVVFALITVVHPVGFVAVALFAEGFVLLAALPVVLDWSELHTGPERAGAAVGFLLLAGNLGGVVLVLVVQGVIGDPYLSLGALSVAGLAGLALAARLPARLADGAGADGTGAASTGAASTGERRPDRGG